MKLSISVKCFTKTFSVWRHWMQRSAQCWQWQTILWLKPSARLNSWWWMGLLGWATRIELAFCLLLSIILPLSIRPKYTCSWTETLPVHALCFLSHFLVILAYNIYYTWNKSQSDLGSQNGDSILYCQQWLLGFHYSQLGLRVGIWGIVNPTGSHRVTKAWVNREKICKIDKNRQNRQK